MKMSEQIRIEGVSIKLSENKPGIYKITIFIKNVGEVKADINSAYVFNIYGNVFCSEILNISLQPGEVNTISLECKLEERAPYFAKVATKKGQESLYSFNI
ncbi:MULTISPECIES: hypothetical protein [Fervidicoccus]|nr:hypothetical protein [Fervidicoccus fontis]PMB75673.1 MAG: hypothetical protein C0188_02110 [Fervidicoccus fontis]PMB78165.1 MAG: hypothetical protein C0177_01175 [Fervidicoccus fontis]HEW64027.1 hypothetical protein [Fervidicoccus fontis]